MINGLNNNIQNCVHEKIYIVHMFYVIRNNINARIAGRLHHTQAGWQDINVKPML